MVNCDTCLGGGHNYNHKAERRTSQISESLEKNIQNERLPILPWEKLSLKNC